MLGLSATAVVPYANLATGASGALWYLAIATVGTAMTVVGIWQAPPARRRIWIAIASASVLYLIGDGLWVLYEHVLDIAPYPSVADAAYLLRYVAFAIALAWLVRSREKREDRAAFLDAAIVSSAIAVVAAVFLIVPAAKAGGESLLSQIVAGAYPVGDVLLLAMLVRLLTSRVVRNLSFTALAFGLVMLLASDVLYTYDVVSGIALPVWSDCGYLASYLLFGFAAMHPSSRSMTEPVSRPETRLPMVRVLSLTAAAVLSPALLLGLQIKGDVSTVILGVGAILTTLLVVARFVDLLRRGEVQAERLASQARNDGLTGVANRRSWDYELARACAQAAELGTTVTVALLDLDHFKLFNDHYGHPAGDLVLKEATAAWVHRLGGRGFVARYGGEEFAVLVPNCNLNAAEPLLDRLRAVPQDQTCSIGATTTDGSEPVADVMDRVDEALYFAKRAGRNQLAVYDGGEIHIASPASSWAAIADLVPVFQPIVDLRDGTVVGHEALSRFGERPPAEVFEEALVNGTSVILQARAIEAALRARPPQGWLSLNISVSAILEPEIQAVLPHDLTGLVFEVTEHEVSEACDDGLAAVRSLRDRGARIAVDDLGVGFSNLQRLLSLVPEIIKLDMSLVRDVHRNPGQLALIRALVTYAVQMNLDLCAEGVEESAEAHTLLNVGVHFAQGFLYGRPLPRIPSTRADEADREVVLT